MCDRFGVRDLRGMDVLDFGCGVRFTYAFLNRSVPVGSYVGVDMSSEVIAFLRSHVTDDRFAYIDLDARNDLYNPVG